MSHLTVALLIAGLGALLLILRACVTSDWLRREASLMRWRRAMRQRQRRRPIDRETFPYSTRATGSEVDPDPSVPARLPELARW